MPTAAGLHLADLLARPGPYRTRWVRQVARATPAPVNQAAVTRVLAQWLWANGEGEESEMLPRTLRDRVSRALGGRLLSAGTLRLFAAAFGLSEQDEARLWSLLDGPPGPQSDCAPARPGGIVPDMTTPTPSATPPSSATPPAAPAPAPAVRRLAADEWTRYRDVRLAALAQAPEAFGSTHAREAEFTEERWRERLAARNTVVAELDGEPRGLVGLVTAGEGETELVSMWVHPQARGLGVGDRLVRAAIERAEELGRPAVRLWVAEGNAPAERLYARHGFHRTGQVQPVDDEQPGRGMEFAMARPAGG